jgi:hypothetical protein
VDHFSGARSKQPPINKQDIAWQFLRKNLNYNHDYEQNHTGTMHIIKNIGVPCTIQKTSDIAAKEWGLFAFSNPRMSSAEQRLFWSIAPTLDAEIIPNGQTPLLPLIHKSDATISGLLLLDGDLVLRIEHAMKTVQLRVKNGLDFNENTCIALRLPVDLSLPINLSKGLDLWNIASGERFKKLVNQTKRIITNCFASLTACWPERVIAR